MPRLLLRFTIILIAVFIVTGCSVHNKSVMTTDSSLGLNFGTDPVSKVDAGLATNSGIVTPTFEGGKTFPILSAFTTRAGRVNKFFNGQSSTMANGDAAYIMSYIYSDCYDKIKPIEDYPMIGLTFRPKTFPKSKNTRHVTSTTSKILGLNLQWFKVPLFPSGIKAGFNRNEDITTPIMAEFINEEETKYIVQSPSIIATIDHKADLKYTAEEREAKGKPYKYVQYIAVGEAAKQLAFHSDSRRSFFKRMNPNTDVNFCEDNAKALPAFMQR